MSEEATSTATDTTTAEAVAEPDATLTTDGVTATETEAAAETATGETTGTEATTTETGTEATTTEGAKPEGDDGEDDTDSEGAPEEYAEFTMPEGVELDAEMAGQFKGVAKELNLTQAQAQRIADLAVTMRQRDAETIVGLREEWVNQSKADKEFGGDKLDASLATAKKAINAYGTPQFIQLLNESGLGNHPEFVRFCTRAGRSVAEESVVVGGNKISSPNRSLAEKLYGPNKE